MRCSISSRAGQVLARGHLFVCQEDDGELRLNFKSDRGTLIEGGIIDPDGDMTAASQVLMRQFFETWHMTDLTLAATSKG
ncbi:MAG: hypothetical protein SVX43_16055 [Cyanobacteriota bacterium]|nr:hypothetical protein [Cyanobacteriota bacterium]